MTNGALVAAASVLLLLAPGARSSEQSGDAVRAAFLAAYNLDYEPAIEHARRAVAVDPDSPRVQRGLASILWLEILFRRGAVSVDHYMGNVTKSQLLLPKPDPAMAEEFKRALNKSMELANARLKANPNDIQAKFDAGAAYGLQASYVASVEGSVMSAFGIAKRSFQTQEEVLEREPARVSAGLVVGTYRYLISTLNLPTRWMAYIVGFHGGKEKGIAMVEAAARDPDTHVDAQAALMLIYSREGRHADVVRISRQLAAEFPRNRLFVLEEGAASIRAGQSADAEAALTRGLEMFEHDIRPKLPGEHAIWLYKRGLARLNLNRLPAAAADLQRALEVQPTDWVRGRIHVELGKLADLAGRRADAVTAYRTARTMCETSADTPCVNEASRLLKRPFSFTKK